MKGLATHTESIIEQVSKLECIKPYILVGGTALAVQIHHRLSEDLDFMAWNNGKGNIKEVDWVTIEKELKSVGELQSTDIISFQQVGFVVSGVKLSFYISDKKSPVKDTIPFLNHILLADIDSIASMKMEVMLRRFKFRDYYDLYCIFNDRSDEEIKQLIDNALRYSGHCLKTRNLIAALSSAERFKDDNTFMQLSPRFDVTATDIEQFMKERLKSVYK